jgi:glycosyltransferase involved in cell wall biosynthesis
MKHRYHLWMPNIFGFKGGIQVYSAFLLKSLQQLYPQDEYSVFLKHDVQPSVGVAYLPQTRFYFAGRWLLPLRTLIFSAQIMGQAIWQRPDLIIATHLNFIVLAHWLKRFMGIPYWTVAHGVEAWDIHQPYLKAALQAADQVLCVSGYTRDRLLQTQALDPDRLVILANTFDSNRFYIAPKPPELLQRYGLSATQPIILTVSRLVRSQQYKGYEKILAALPQVRHALPDVHYILVGQGDDRLWIEQQIAALNLQKSVTLAGFVPDPELCDYYNLCDVFAMPSKREGFGIVYLEALACGKPTLAGNQDGAVDALCYGALGLLVNPDDTDAVAQSLIHLLHKSCPNPVLFQPETLRQKAIEHFGFEAFQQKLAHYLEHHFDRYDGSKK